MYPANAEKSAFGTKKNRKSKIHLSDRHVKFQSAFGVKDQAVESPKPGVIANPGFTSERQ